MPIVVPLEDAANEAASPQIRNLATIGANLLQKTRCAYFRSDQPVRCNRRVPGSGCAAREGHDDRHALFGWTDECIATQPSDPAVALAALDAHVVTRSAGGGRRIPVTDFHLLRDSTLTLGQGVHGVRVTFDYTYPGVGTNTFDQVALTNADDTEVYLLLVHCLAACYSEHQSQIDTVMNSFTVRSP